jgi:antitoxin ParD1/3/4
MDMQYPIDVQGFVQIAIESGRYASERELICDALRLMQARDEHLAALHREIQEGLQDAERGDLLEADDVFAELRDRNSVVSPNT